MEVNNIYLIFCGLIFISFIGFLIWVVSIYERFNALKLEVEKQKVRSETAKAALDNAGDSELRDILAKNIGTTKE